MRSRSFAAFVFVLIVAGTVPVLLQAQDSREDLVFIVAADMRNFAADGEWSKNFSGACEAVKEVGAGSFMISPGDLDVRPPSAVRDMINQTIGKDYPWYPVLGNHDPESPSSMEYLREYSTTLPNVVNRGPKGCEETTFSFDYGNAHFVVLNQYYDGTNDWGLEGAVVPELLEWLKADLAATTKKHIFAPYRRIRPIYFKGSSVGIIDFIFDDEPRLMYRIIDIHGRNVSEPFVVRADELVNGVVSWPEKVHDVSRQRQEFYDDGKGYYEIEAED